MGRINNMLRQDGGMDRRSFLKLSGLLGIGAASATIVPVSAEAVRFNRKLVKVSKTRLAMGTFVSMTLIHHSTDQAQEAMGLAFEEIDRLAGLLSRFNESAAVAQLNKEGYLKGVPPELMLVVSRALYYNNLTGGSFDITVKPVIDLFVKDFEGSKKRIPSEAELQKVLRFVGSEKVKVKQGSIFFKRPGMGITLDGIAKGFIVDRASEILTRNKIKNHLINAGGDIRTKGSKAKGRPWSIAIQDPLKRKHYPDIIQMRDGAIATSGNYEVYFDREKMFYHIVDPKTGLSPEMTTSVSVTARTTMEADALSTSVFVMGPRKGMAFINRLQNCESLVVSRGGTLSKSRGWKSAAI
ncbi:MAG: FAD:protein FMN transferase [Deltaproteobacteria bacterium]|nr:MAG: FAD:protein FMN transferase [Deltaproteobacteria bacterium]